MWPKPGLFQCVTNPGPQCRTDFHKLSLCAAVVSIGFTLCGVGQCSAPTTRSLASCTDVTDFGEQLSPWQGGCWLSACITSQQHASVSQARICSDNFMCCHTEIEAAHQTFHLTQSQYTDTGPASPSADPIAPGTWSSSF